MDKISKVVGSPDLPSSIAGVGIAQLPEDDYQEWLCATENRKRIEPQGGDDIDCPVCGNKGILLRWDRELQARVSQTCDCEQARRSIRRLDRSGVCRDWREKRIDNFVVSDGWQKVLRQAVENYIQDKNRGWLFVSGQSGCGKTHLCTAAFVALVRSGMSGRYVRWIELAQKLDGAYFHNGEFESLVKPFMTCRILYLDDLFKTRGNEVVSDRVFQNAMRILDARYQNPDLLTILSTEWTLDRLIAFDEALGGRIAERCGKYIVQVAQVDGRNYRLK